MLRFSLWSLAKLITVACIYFAFSQSAGYVVTLAIGTCICLICWSIRSRKRGFVLFVRYVTTFASMLGLWMLGVDYSVMSWVCPDCHLHQTDYHYRALGIPFWSETHVGDSCFNEVLIDLGKPCLHQQTGWMHEYRIWGLLIPTYSEDAGYYGISGNSERYTATISQRLQVRGQADPEFAAEMHRKIVKEHDYRFFWEGFMADETVLDSLGDNTAREAIDWLEDPSGAVAYSNIGYWYGSICPTPSMLSGVIGEMYDAGAKRVLAVGIVQVSVIQIDGEIYREGDFSGSGMSNKEISRYDFAQERDVEECDYIALELPSECSARQRVFDWEAKCRLLQQYRPTKDYGQKYLLIELGEFSQYR